MNHFVAVLHLLDNVLGLQGRGLAFRPETPLLGAVPELDSMAVVALVSALESRFAIQIDDEDLDAATFATAGTLSAMLERKILA